MKRTTFLAALIAANVAAWAQTLNVSVGDVTYLFPAAQAGEMTFSDGTTLTIMGKSFTLADVTAMTVTADEVADNTVSVTYDGTSAKIRVAGNVAQYVEPETTGAHVYVKQTNTDDVDGDEITYSLSGSSTDGNFFLFGNYKATVELCGLSLTNASTTYSGAAIHIQNGKRAAISVKRDTENTLRDFSGGEQKGCIYAKGHLELKGQGSLNIYGNYKHGIKSGEYTTMKNCTINVLSAVGDGLNCAEYFIMESGTLNISGTGDDGLQCDIDGDATTGETIDHEDEDSGNIYIAGGTMGISVTANAAKCIKANGSVIVTNGTLTLNTSGSGMWDTDDLETKAAAAISSDANLTISGGSITASSTGSGGKGLKCDSVLTVTGGEIRVATSGGLYYNNGSTENTNYTGNTDNVSSNYYSSPKGIKAGLKTTSGNTTTYAGGIDIAGGTIVITTAGRNGEGLESKSYLNVTGGEIAVTAYDDAINAAQDITVSDGRVYARANNNDGLDSNGNLYVKGGLVYAIGASSPEVAIDANSEEQKKLYLTGGTLIAIGGLESGASLSQTCYSSSSWSKSTWYAMTFGSSTVAFKTPASGGTTLVVSAASTPTLKSGVTVADGTAVFDGMAYVDASVTGGSSVTLSQYTSSNTGGGGNNSRPGGR